MVIEPNSGAHIAELGAIEVANGVTVRSQKLAAEDVGQMMEGSGYNR